MLWYYNGRAHGEIWVISHVRRANISLQAVEVEILTASIILKTEGGK